MTEIEIIEKLKGSRSSHDQAMSFLYSSKAYREPIFFFLKSKGISNDECNLLWTDIVVKFCLLVKSEKYEHQGKLIGYIKNLSGYMVLNHFRAQKNVKTDDISMTLIKDQYVEENTLNHKELKDLLEEQLSLLGDVCKSILEYWSLDYSMQEIMKKLKLVSVEATRKRKHICLKKLLDNINSKEEVLTLFKDFKYEE